MHQGLNAYAAAAKTAQNVQPPRELEANLLLKAAVKLQLISDDWVTRAAELDDALTYNRRLWTILVSAVASEENPLAREIKHNIYNIANFIFGHTIRVSAAPAPEKLAVLVTINRDIAAGLRGR